MGPEPQTREQLIEELRGASDEMGRQVAELLKAYGQTSEAAYLAEFSATFSRGADALEQAGADLRSLREAVEAHVARGHYECEDGWYSCPKHPNYFGPDPTDKCYCGQDALAAALSADPSPADTKGQS